MYSIIGFETDSKQEFDSMKVIVWGFITALICWINPYIGGAMALGIFSLYKKRGENKQREFIKMTIFFLSIPFIILGLMLSLSAFA